MNNPAVFLKTLNHVSMLVTILGARGSGKTALAFRIAEVLHEKYDKPVAVYNAAVDLPEYFEVFDRIGEIEYYNNYLVIFDEGAISLSARDAMTKRNKLLSKFLAITRHKDISILFITQVAAVLDINVLRYSDALLVKRPARFQSKFERMQLRDYLESIRLIINKTAHRLGINWKELVYVDSDVYEGLARIRLPTFWNEQISKAFSKTNMLVKTEAHIEDLEELREYYEQVRSIRKVAKKFGMTYYQARELLIQAGVEFGKRGRKRQKSAEFASDDIFVSEVVA